MCAPCLPFETLISDEDLIRATAAGEHGSFTLLMERYRSPVFHLARTIVASRQDAEDVVQQTFLAVYRFAHQFRGDSLFRTWLFRIARNAAQQARMRQIRHGEPFISIDTQAVQLRRPGEDPEQTAIRLERLARLRTVVATLKPQDRQVIYLRDVKGLSGESTARILGIEVGTVKTRLHRARSRLVTAFG